MSTEQKSDMAFLQHDLEEGIACLRRLHTSLDPRRVKDEMDQREQARGIDIEMGDLRLLLEQGRLHIVKLAAAFTGLHEDARRTDRTFLSF